MRASIPYLSVRYVRYGLKKLPGYRYTLPNIPLQNSHQIYHIRGRARVDLPKPPPNRRRPCTKRGLRWEAPWRCSGDTIRHAEHSRSQAPGITRRYSDNVPVVQRQFASGGTDGWFGGADSDCRPSSTISRDERAGGPFPAPRTV